MTYTAFPVPSSTFADFTKARGTAYAEKEGIDCTGASDASEDLQALIDAVEDGTTIHFPSLVAGTNPIIKIGTTINLADRRGIRFVSDSWPVNNGPGPIFTWIGSGGGVGNNVVMFNIAHCSSIQFHGLRFAMATGTTLDTFLDFDGEPGNSIGTLGRVVGCTFSWIGTNSDFKAVSISRTALNNHENYVVEDCEFYGGGNIDHEVRSSIAVTNGTTTVTAANAAFVAGDVGRRIRISYAGGVKDTTIATRVSGTEITVASAPSFSETGCRIHLGQGYGTGIYVGGNANSKHHFFTRIRGSSTEHTIRILAGSFTINTVGGSFNDYGIRIGGSITEPSFIINYNAEDDMRGIDITPGDCEIFITGTRGSGNTAQLFNGFLSLGGKIMLSGTSSPSPTFPSNARFIAFNSASEIEMVSIGNHWSANGLTTTALLGYDNLPSGRIVSINDDLIGSPFAIIGIPKTAPTNTAAMWNSGGLRIGPRFVEYTDTRTLTISDANKTLDMNKATAVQARIGADTGNPAIDIPVGAEIEVVQLGAGQVSFFAIDGIPTILSEGGFLKIAARYGKAKLRHRATNEWVLTGNLAA